MYAYSLVKWSGKGTYVPAEILRLSTRLLSNSLTLRYVQERYNYSAAQKHCIGLFARSCDRP